MNILRPHYVYRLFADDGSLLYIGHAEDVADRLHYHLAWANFGRPVTRGLMCRLAAVTMWRYPDKLSAAQAEREAIRAEAPLLNRSHNLGRHVELDAYPADAEPNDADRLMARSHAVLRTTQTAAPVPYSTAGAA